MSRFRAIHALAIRHPNTPTPAPTPPEPPPSGYSTIVNGLAGGGPLAYWRMNSTASIVDEEGNLNGTLGGTVSAAAALVPQSDGAVNFSGAGAGVIPHGGSLVLNAFTLSFWVRPNTLPAAQELADPFFGKNAAGTNAGDFSIYAPPSGDQDLTAQFNTGAGNVAVTTTAAVLQVGTAHHICVRADNTGFDLFVDGVFYGKSTAYTGAWSVNTADIQLATVTDFSGVADCVLDEIALYNRVLTNAEVFELALRSAAPVAADDTAAVPESATTAIDVTGNDTFVGAKADLTVTVVGQPAGGDSAAVNASNDINYTAGAVASDTARSFTYKIEDANGESNTATVSVTVQNSSTPTVSNANCYTESSADTVIVASMAALQTAINAAPAGRNILIASGTYAGGTFTFDPAGTEAAPIVVRPQSGLGTVTINNPNWTLAPGSARLVISKLHFNNAHITINGSHHRVTRCRFRQVNQRIFQINAATDTRLDHLDVSDFVNSTNSKEMVVVSHTNVANGSLRRLLMDYVYFHDISHATAPTTSSGLMRTVGIEAAVNANPEIVIDHCLMRNNQVTGWGEFIVIKHSGCKIRFCTFENQNGYLEQRTGGGWELRSCWFENVTGNGPVICFDRFAAGTNSGAGRQLVIGNRIINGDLWVGCGDQDCDDADGTTDVTPGGHHRSRLGRFIGNIVTGGTIRVGEQFGNDIDTFRALDNNLWNNTGTEVLLFQTGTTHNQDNEAFVPAVKLAPTDVGLAAPDPLCPSGPQS